MTDFWDIDFHKLQKPTFASQNFIFSRNLNFPSRGEKKLVQCNDQYV